MSKIKSVAIIVMVLIALFGVQQVLKRHATASYTDIFMKDEFKARKDLATYLLPEMNDLYNKECASCHFLYNPGLLSSESWERIIKESSNHFGNDLKLTNETKREFILYLTDNSTDKGFMNAKDEVILGLRDKNGNAPLKVTETRYIKNAHSKIDPSVFDREAVGGFNNCGSCHERP